MKQVATKQEATTELVPFDVEWNIEAGTDDMLIPKILLQQKTSDGVEAGIAKPGDFMDSVEQVVLGGEKDAVEIIIFDSFKTLVTMRGREFVSIEPYTAENAGLPWQDGDLSRTKTFNFYCLLAGDEVGLPYVLSLSRTSTKAAKTIITAIKKLSFMKKPMAAKTFLLTSRKESNDKGSWFVVDVKMGRDTSPTELKGAYEWFQNIRKGAVKATIHEPEQRVEVNEPRGAMVVEESEELTF